MSLRDKERASSCFSLRSRVIKIEVKGKPRSRLVHLGSNDQLVPPIDLFKNVVSGDRRSEIDFQPLSIRFGGDKGKGPSQMIERIISGSFHSVYLLFFFSILMRNLFYTLEDPSLLTSPNFQINGKLTAPLRKDE